MSLEETKRNGNRRDFLFSRCEFCDNEGGMWAIGRLPMGDSGASVVELYRETAEHEDKLADDPSVENVREHSRKLAGCVAAILNGGAYVGVSVEDVESRFDRYACERIVDFCLTGLTPEEYETRRKANEERQSKQWEWMRDIVHMGLASGKWANLQEAMTGAKKEVEQGNPSE